MLIDETCAVTHVYVVNGGTKTDKIVHMGAEGSHVRGEVIGGTYGVDCTGGSLSVNGTAPGCTVGVLVV